MKYSVRTSRLETKLPAAFQPPACFQAFIAAVRSVPYGSLGFFTVAYSDPQSISGLNGDASNQLVPFLCLGEGSLVCFCFAFGSKPSIVSLGSEGEHSALAKSFPDFLARWRDRSTGLPDLDGFEGDFPRLRGVPAKPAKLTELRKRFKRWLKENSDESVEVTSNGADLGRRFLERVLPRMKEHAFQRKFVVTLTKRTEKIQWYDGGLRDYPEPDELAPLLHELSKAVGRPLKEDTIIVNRNASLFLNGATVEA